MAVLQPERAREGLRVWILALVAVAIGLALAASGVREAAAAVGTCQLLSNAFSVTEGDPVNIPVQRTGGDEASDVAYTTTNISASPGDWTPFGGTLSFFASDTGTVTKSITINTVDNAIAGDGGRQFELEISEAVGGGQVACNITGNTTATITINDDDGPQPPTVTNLSKKSGTTEGGTVVVITGTKFTDVDCDAPGFGVTFGGTEVTGCNVDSDTQITATTPLHAAGPVDVVVTNPNGSNLNTAADNFVYGAGAIVHSVTPNNAPAGVNTGGIVIMGEKFNTVDCTLPGLGVDFGAIDAVSCNVDSDTQITATAPAQSVGMVNVRVTNNVAISPDTTDDDFTYTGNAPVISSLNPASGPLAGGNTVTINGSFFTGATSVTFGGIPGTSVVVAGNGNSLTVTVPPGMAIGTVNVQVNTPSGSSSTAGNADDYTYTTGPTITGLSPDEGPTGGGTVVQIAGTNLLGVTSVTFGGINATAFTINSAILITATAPPHALGLVDVRVTNASGTSPNTVNDDYEYVGGPNITSVTPSGGPVTGGTVVVIKGSGFTGATSVVFGITAATSFSIINDTTINAVAPAHAKGVVHVRVTAPGGTSPEVNADRYTYGEPSVSGVSPDSGPKTGGNFVTISGSNFTGATIVRFGTNSSPIFDVTDDSTIVAQVPAGSGIVHVTVTTAAGTSATHDGDRYTYNALPTITSLSPTSGPAAGGTTVIISGSDFTGATSVVFGTKTAASFIVNNDGQISAVSPSGTPGDVNVRVITPKGTSPTGNATVFTYQSAGGTTLYTLSFRWNLITWAGLNNIDIVVALQSLDGNTTTNSIWQQVTAVYFYTGTSWQRFFPQGVNVPGVNTITVLTYGGAYWVAVNQNINWTVSSGP